MKLKTRKLLLLSICSVFLTAWLTSCSTDSSREKEDKDEQTTTTAVTTTTTEITTEQSKIPYDADLFPIPPIQEETEPEAEPDMLMPSLIGMDFEEAKLTYKDQLQLEVISYEYSDYERDRIFGQDIEVDTPIRTGDRVGVKVSIGGKKVTLPNVVGWDYSTAESTLRSLNLNVFKYTVYDAEIAEGQVVSTEPEGPCELEPGTTVRVVVSLGKNSNTVIVPDFVNMNWDTARKAAEELGLVVSQQTVADSAPKGTVIAQGIKAGEEADEGTAMLLWVSDGTR